jgi:hypothetical protein
MANLFRGLARISNVGHDFSGEDRFLRSVRNNGTFSVYLSDYVGQSVKFSDFVGLISSLNDF